MELDEKWIVQNTIRLCPWQGRIHIFFKQRMNKADVIRDPIDILKDVNEDDQCKEVQILLKSLQCLSTL